MKIFLILFILLVSEAANAKKFTFGDRESIGFLETTPIVTEKGEALFLGYKTTEVSFFIPLYNKDDGYILGKMSNFGQTFYLLSNNQDKLKTWQQNGQLPKILPKYHINVVNSSVIIMIVFMFLLLVIPIIYNYLKNKISESGAKLLLTIGILIPLGYVIYKIIPSGAKKQRLISTIKQWNTCAVKLDFACVEECLPNIVIKQFSRDYNMSFLEGLKQLDKHMKENQFKILDKELDETFSIKKSNVFHNVYTATGSSTMTYTQKNKKNKSKETFFAVSIDDGKSWKVAGTGNKASMDILSVAYPFVEDLKNNRRQ